MNPHAGYLGRGFLFCANSLSAAKGPGWNLHQSPEGVLQSDRVEPFCPEGGSKAKTGNH